MMFMLMLLLPELVLLLLLDVLLIQLHIPDLLLLRVLAGTTSSMGIKLRTVKNPAQSQKTSSPAGGASFLTCWSLRYKF